MQFLYSFIYILKLLTDFYFPEYVEGKKINRSSCFVLLNFHPFYAKDDVSWVLFKVLLQFPLSDLFKQKTSVLLTSIFFFTTAVGN